MFTYTRPSRLPLRFTSSPSPEWKQIHLIADGLEPILRQSFIDSVGRVSADVELNQLAESLRLNSMKQALDLFDMNILEEELTDASMQMMRDAMKQAGDMTVQFMPDIAADLSFDLTNPTAVTWASVNSSSLVTGVNSKTVDGLRFLIRRSIIDGIPPREAATFIKDMVGLTERQSNAMYNFRQKLVADNTPRKVMDALVDAKYEAMLQHRAETIARTETIKAASMGQQLLWEDAELNGFLPTGTQKIWIITPDDRLCETICLPMAGQTVPLRSSFKTGDGRDVLTPPAHPACRCAEGLVFDE